jgi:hypothetical protein
MYPSNPQLPSLWYAEAVQSEKIDTDEVAVDISAFYGECGY